MVTNNSSDYSPTQYNVQTGGANGTLNNVAPSSTTGVPVVSQGASSQPAFGTAVVAGGGTGDTSFTAYAPVCGGTSTTGALQSADTGISSSGFVLTSNGASALPTWQAAAAGGVATVNGDTGSMTGTTVTISAGQSTRVCGESVQFTNSGAASSFTVTDAHENTCIGNSCGPTSTPSAGGENTALGYGNLTSLGNAQYNVVVGTQSLTALTTGHDNIAIGFDVLTHMVTGSDNIGMGEGSLVSATGSTNIGIGTTSLGSLTSGANNIALGSASGNQYTSSESSNIVIGNGGTAAESHVIRIGTQGSSAGQQNACCVAGITGVAPVDGNIPQVTLTDNLGNLSVTSSSTAGFVLTSNGTAAPTFQAAGGGGGGITTIDGDVGSVTGATVTISGQAGWSFTAGATVEFVNNTGNSLQLLLGNLYGNTIIGRNAGLVMPLGFSNFNNTSLGDQTLIAYGSGFNNTAIGALSLSQLTAGGGNTCLGYNAGRAYTTTEDSNILIGPVGLVGESNATRIGYNNGSDLSSTQTTCFIDGIAGVTVANSAAVLIDTTTGQLGTAVSSRRYKDDIEDMAGESSPIMNLRPVTFTLKSDQTKAKQFGLIAEEVAETMPEMVVYNLEGKPETVKYHDLPVLLLNEIQKLRKEIETLKSMQRI